jgi:hypothetical protein
MLTWLCHAKRGSERNAHSDMMSLSSCLLKTFAVSVTRFIAHDSSARKSPRSQLYKRLRALAPGGARMRAFSGAHFFLGAV